MNIPEYRLVLHPQSTEAAKELGFKWANDEVGKRSKVGGEPEFLIESTVPVCADCAKKMTFYAQIDSVGDNISLADVGMVFVFVCFDCLKTESILQSG